MTTPISFRLPYPPSANRYWRNVNGRTLKSREARAYTTECGWMAKSQIDSDMASGPVAVTFRMYRPRRSGDLDNRIKVVLDALQGIAYADDSQVVEIHAYRDDDKHDPRLEVEIHEVIE